MKILDNSDLSYSEWTVFLEEHPDSNIFHTPEMYKIYDASMKYSPYLISVVDDDKSILGILLAAIQKEKTGFLGKLTARSVIWGGPLVKDNNPEVLRFLLNSYNIKIGGEAIYSQFRNLWEPDSAIIDIFRLNKYNYEDHLDIIIDLTKTEKVLYENLHKGRRKNINRASRNSLEFSEILDKDDLDICLNLIEKTYKRVKLPCPDRNFFYSSNDILGKKGYIRKFVVKFKNEIIGCRLVLCYKDMVYDWYAGADESQLDKYPNDYLPWMVILWAKANGYKKFDFGGAGKPNEPYGVREFKTKFGGELVNYGRFISVHKKGFYRIGTWGIKMIRNLK